MKSSSEDDLEDYAAEQILDGMSDKLIKKVWNNLPKNVKDGIKDPNPMEAVMKRMRSMRDVVPDFSSYSLPAMPSSSSEVNVDGLIEEANNYIKSIGTTELLTQPRATRNFPQQNSYVTRYNTPPIIGFTKNAQTLNPPESQFNTRSIDQPLALAHPNRPRPPCPPANVVVMPEICFDTIHKPRITEIFEPKIQKYSKLISKQLAEVDKYSIQLEQCMNKKKVLIASIAKLHGKALSLCRVVHQMETDITKIRMQVCGTFVFTSVEKSGPCGSFCCRGVINKIVDLQHKLEKVRSRAMLKGCFLAMCEAAENRIQNENVVLKKDIRRATGMAKELANEFEVIRKVVCKMKRSAIKQPHRPGLHKPKPSKPGPPQPSRKITKAINHLASSAKNNEWFELNGQHVSGPGSTWYFSGGSSDDETDIQNQSAQNYHAESSDSEEFLKQINNALAESNDQSDESIQSERRYRKRAGSESSKNSFQTPPQSENDSGPSDLDEILNTASDEEIRMVSFTITTSSSHRSSKSPENQKAKSSRKHLRDDSQGKDRDEIEASTSKAAKRISRKEAAKKDFCECGQIIKGPRCSCGKKASKNIPIKPQEHISDAESAKSYLMSVKNYNESHEERTYPASIPRDSNKNKAYVVKPLSPSRPRNQQVKEIENSNIITKKTSKEVDEKALQANRNKPNPEKVSKVITDGKSRRLYSKTPQTDTPAVKLNMKKVIKSERPNNHCPPPSIKSSRKTLIKSKQSNNLCICTGIPGPCKCPGCSCEASRNTIQNETVLKERNKSNRSNSQTGKSGQGAKAKPEKGPCVCYNIKGERPCPCPDCDCESDSSVNTHIRRNEARQKYSSSQKVNVCICTGKEGPCDCPNCSCQSIVKSGEASKNSSKLLERKPKLSQKGSSDNKICICNDKKGEAQCCCPDCTCESDASEENISSSIISRRPSDEKQQKEKTIRNVCICTGKEGPCECPNCSCQSIVDSVRISIKRNGDEDGTAKVSKNKSEQVKQGTCICYEREGEHSCPCPECTCESSASNMPNSISEESSEDKLQKRSQIKNVCICTGKEGPCECPQCSCQSIEHSVQRSIQHSSEEEISVERIKETPETSQEKISVASKDRGVCMCPKDNKNKTCLCPDCTCIRRDDKASEKSEDSGDVSSAVETKEADKTNKGKCLCSKNSKSKPCKCSDCTCGRDTAEATSSIGTSADALERKESNKNASKKSSRHQSIPSPAASDNICTCTSKEGPCKCPSCSCSATSKITDRVDKSTQPSKESIGQTVQTDSSANESCTCSVCPLKTDKEKLSSSETIIPQTPPTLESADERSRQSSKKPQDSVKKDAKKPSHQSSSEQEEIMTRKERSTSKIQRDSLRHPEKDRSRTPSRKRKKSPAIPEKKQKDPSRTPSTAEKRKKSSIKEIKPPKSLTSDKSQEDFETKRDSTKKQISEKDVYSKKSDRGLDTKTKSKSQRSTESSSNESLERKGGIIQDIIPQDPLAFESDDNSSKRNEGIQEITLQDTLTFEADESSKKNEGMVQEIIPQDPLTYETDDETEIRSTTISPKEEQKDSKTSILPDKSLLTPKLPEKRKSSTYEVVVTEIPNEQDKSSRKKSKSKTFDVVKEPLDRKGSDSRRETMQKKPSTPGTPSKSKPFIVAPSKDITGEDNVAEKDISRRSSKHPSRLPSVSPSKPSIGHENSLTSSLEDNKLNRESLKDGKSQPSIKQEKSAELRRKSSKVPSKQPSRTPGYTEIDKNKVSKQPSKAPSTKRDDKDMATIPSRKGEQSRWSSSKTIEKPEDEVLRAPPPSRKPSSIFREEITKEPENLPNKQPSFYSESQKPDKEPDKHISRRSSKVPSIRFEDDVEDNGKASRSPSGKQIPSKIPPAENGKQGVRRPSSQDRLSQSSILTIMRDCQEKLRECQTENEQLDFQRKSTAAQIQRLQGDLETCRKNYEDCLAGKVSDRSVLKEISSLQNENTRLKQEVDKLKVVANNLEIDNDVLKEENDKLKAGRLHMPADNEKTPMDCLPFIEKIAKLESQIVTMNLEKDNILKEYADCKGKLASNQQQLSKCLKDLEPSHHDITEEIIKPIQTTDCTEWVELAHKYEAKLKDYRIRSVKSALLAEISAKQRDDLKHEIVELREALKNTQEDLTKCLAENTTGPLQNQIALMQDELAKFKDAINQYETSNNQLKREKEGIAAELEAVEGKLKKREEEIQNITEGGESYIAQQYTKLRTENNELVVELDNKKREIERLNLNVDWCNKRWAECKSKLESYEAKIGGTLRENKDDSAHSDATLRSARESDGAQRYGHKIVPFDPEARPTPSERQPEIEKRSSIATEKERSHSTKVEPNDPSRETKPSLLGERDTNLEREIKEHYKDVQLSKKMYKFLQCELQKVVHKLNLIPCCENVQDELVKIYLAIDWMRTRICRCYPDPREFHFTPKCVEGSDPVLHGICLQVVVAGVRSLNLRQLIYLHCTVYKVGSEFAKTNCLRFNCKQFGVAKRTGHEKDKRKRKKMAMKKLKRLETEMDRARKLLCNLKEFCKGQPGSEMPC